MMHSDKPEYWLGMRINSERYALPASAVQSVFLYPEAEQSLNDLRISGVVVHEGAPVYLRNHFQVLRFNRRSETLAHWQQVLKPGNAPWILVLKEGPNQGLGFRVNNIAGPFHASVLSDRQYYLTESRSWVSGKEYCRSLPRLRLKRLLVRASPWGRLSIIGGFLGSVNQPDSLARKNL